MQKVFQGLIISSCTGFFVYQSYQNIDIHLKYPTARTHSKTALGHVGLPRMEVCLKYGFDIEFLELQGYGDGGLGGYVIGQTDDSFIDWAGNGSFTEEELRDRALVWKKSEEVLEEVTTYDPRNKWMLVKMEEVGI